MEKADHTNIKPSFLTKLKDFGILTAGTICVALGIYFFKFPNNFCMGGVSGISIILSHFVPNLSSGTFVMILNVALLLLGFIFVSNEFGLKSVYCTLLFSGFTYVMEFICPLSESLTGDMFFDMFMAVLLPAIGSALLFNYDASTGGTDIIAMIIRKFSGGRLNISKALLAADFLIVMLTAVVFDIRIWLYCLIGFLMKSLIVNNVLESMNTSKYFTIICEKGEEVCDYIINVLHKDATLSHDFSGAFTHQNKYVVLTVVNRKQALKLRRDLKKIDPNSFVIVANAGDIIGKGFRETI